MITLWTDLARNMGQKLLTAAAMNQLFLESTRAPARFVQSYAPLTLGETIPDHAPTEHESGWERTTPDEHERCQWGRERVKHPRRKKR